MPPGDGRVRLAAASNATLVIWREVHYGVPIQYDATAGLVAAGMPVRYLGVAALVVETQGGNLRLADARHAFIVVDVVEDHAPTVAQEGDFEDADHGRAFRVMRAASAIARSASRTWRGMRARL